MNKIDLIIDALHSAYEDIPGWVEKVNEALYAARELKALQPVAYIDKKGSLFNHTTHPHLCTPLYALDEVTK